MTERWLIGCERSGHVRDAFLRLGIDAVSCDVEPSLAPGPHLQMDVREAMRADTWTGGIFFPPCTRLALSGFVWTRKRLLFHELEWSCELFRACLNAPMPFVAVENPVMHGEAIRRIGRNCDFAIQPWQFGHREQKKTCFWTRGLHELRPTKIIPKRRRDRSFVMQGETKDRAWKKSITFPGVARAMALQWGVLHD